jgi:hypothetical protein
MFVCQRNDIQHKGVISSITANKTAVLLSKKEFYGVSSVVTLF